MRALHVSQGVDNAMSYTDYGNAAGPVEQMKARTNPLDVWNDVFSGLADMPGGGMTAPNPDRLLVDKVLEQYRDLRGNPRLSSQDKQKLEQHVTLLGEVQAPSPTAQRRLQLAAETGGTTALLLHVERHGRDVSAGMGTSMTHWRVAAAASGAAAGAADGVAWPGPVRWQLELLRCRGAAAGTWLVEWQTEKREDHANDNFGIPGAGAPGRLRLADAVCHGPHPAAADARGGERRYAAG